MRKVTGGLVPGLAMLAILGSGGWLATQASGYNTTLDDTMHGSSAWHRGTMSGAGMMADGMMDGGSGRGWSSEEEGAPVEDLQQARDRAEDFAAELGSGLSVGEVMEFANNYYAKLEEADDALATEVLIDPATGDVQLEYGPAMMWNQRYGMMSGPRTQGNMTTEEARQRATEWAQGRGVEVGEADAFPGYYTFHTLRGGKVDGMVSVSAMTRQVWYHDWHGEFLDMSEPH